jgi:hypothetical protein
MHLKTIVAVSSMIGIAVLGLAGIGREIRKSHVIAQILQRTYPEYSFNEHDIAEFETAFRMHWKRAFNPKKDYALDSNTARLMFTPDPSRKYYPKPVSSETTTNA